MLGKKDTANWVHKSVTWGCKLWPQKRRLNERFESVSIRIACDFSINYIYQVPKSLCLSRFFFKYCFNNLCFQLLQKVTSKKTAGIIRHKLCKIGQSYLLSKHFWTIIVITILNKWRTFLKQILCWVPCYLNSSQ